MSRLLTEFITTHPTQPLIVIFGPTGCGKTSMSLEIAKTLKSVEIISVDSRQIYREMNIGTGKITKKEIGDVRHHMLDILDPDKDFSVVDFRQMVEPLLSDIWDRGGIPILCGGTGLYLDSIIFERSYAPIQKNHQRRRELENIAREKGKQEAWEILRDLDPIEAEAIDPGNIHGIIRSIEMYEAGYRKTQIRDTIQLKYPTLFLTPYREGSKAIGEKIPKARKVLYDRINTRVSQMFYDGLIDEVISLREQYRDDSPGLRTIGYREVVAFLQGNITRSECEQQIAQANRNYAKRQICWNQKYTPFLEEKNLDG